MNTRCLFLPTTLLVLGCASIASAQDEPAPITAGAPPKMLLLVHREFQPGKTGERHKLEVAISRACNHLDVPNSWIDLESITGLPEALSFDPFDSFEQVDTAFAEWGRIFATHSEIARMQEELKALVSRESTIIAVRRDDLGYLPQSIDLSKARFMRVLEVRLHPGFESDFVEAFKILAEAYEKIRANTPWVVYQMNVGASSPTFLVFVPMHALKQNDDLLNWRKNLHEAEGEEAAHHLDQIAKDAYAITESNLYVISPEMSHVSKEFAEGDPSFWSSKPNAASRPTPPKSAQDKPNR